MSRTPTRFLKRTPSYPELKKTCSYVYKTHLRKGKLRAVGDSLVQPKLARLLKKLAKHGPDFFYKGPVAKAIAAEMRKHGGLMTQSDLAAYRVRERKPIRSTYRNFEIIGMPPPSSGGVAIAEILNILNTFDLRSIAKRDRGLAIHYQVEAQKHAFADRARWLGDADFANVPVALLTSQVYADQLARLISPWESEDPEVYGSRSGFGGPPDRAVDDAGTSHFCIVDKMGNVVVSTETINTAFGSLAAVGEWGLILNNEMDDFASQPGIPNAFGLVQSVRNKIEPGKRPLSSMAPTIVLRNGEPMLLLGASGGPRIITAVVHVLLSVTDYGQSLEQAIQSPRVHHQWRPDLVFFDAKPLEWMARGLGDRGHTFSKRKRTAVVQAILRTRNGWTGASDPRKGGRPAGY